ncbi:hypothetical protein GHT07_07235 [Caenimonas koreensis DSM 17982]|uniref:Uncharacterized protein n=1 Tax=Caenimonas koreensis DSM 17982 TaxID=1121255 RepID=A0A844B6R2_9BURK|nr:hypothetical protein [Caenimonas koreensis]MRD47066.1 hypothetical protein [Caenimonas koreensis DSM 17982]
MSKVNIQGMGVSQVGLGHHDAQPSAVKAKGTWRGQSLVLAQAGMAQQVMQPQNVAAQGLPAVPDRNVLSRRVSTVAAFHAKAPDDILQRAQAMGVSARDVRNGAMALLNGKQAAAAGKRRDASKLSYLQHQYAAALLEDDVTDDDAAARLTHQGHQARNAEDLAKHVATLLESAADNGEELQHFLEDVLSGLDTTADDVGEDRIERLKDELWEARRDEKRLMEVLRKAQGIPSLDRSKSQQERERMRQKLQDDIQRFESEDLAGADVVPRYNVANVSATAPQPQRFEDAYVELVTKPHTLPQAMQVLLRAYDDIAELIASVVKFQQARADDLNSMPPSRDVIRLGAVISDLGTTFVFSTLIDSARELSDLMTHTGHASAA